MNRLHALVYFPWLELRRLAFGTKHSAEVDVTDNCNLRCGHCYHFHGKDELDRREQPLPVWEQRFADLHDKGVRLIMLVGGEPALRTDVLMLAHGIFPFIFVITNGTVFIPRAFAHRLFLSIDGSRPINDRIRGEGTYDRVLANYSGDDRVVINMVLAAENHTELEHVVRLSLEHGFHGVICNIYTPRNDGENPLELNHADRKKVIAELRRVKALYPHQLLVSRAMIDWYAQPDHRGHCYWGDEAYHFDVSWNRRRCFGLNADCANCGCLAGAAQSPIAMLKHPAEVRALIYEVGDPQDRIAAPAGLARRWLKRVFSRKPVRG
jgi:MoaA/NifB/PqqE/SkfB family radical SAM enzyme